MRAVALAILIGAWGIEVAVRGDGPPKPEDKGTTAVAVAFIVCLVFGW